MKIGIDARLIEETGVGRYIRNLIDHLSTLDTKNQYVIFLRKKSYPAFALPNSRWEKRLADVSWHSVAEQFFMPWILVKEHLDLVHIPYFNVPIFYPGKFIVTIHDLTILHYDTGKATTLPVFLYKLRRAGYFIALSVGLIRAKAIIAVSETTKKEIIDHFQIPSEKITVTYEGVESVLSTKSKVQSNKKRLIEGPYFLYVGNAYPHKNLEALLLAFQRFITRHTSPFFLVLVGKDDYFYRNIKAESDRLELTKNVIFYGYADDEALVNLYTHALALVVPSFMEGFGLPPLEALAYGCPVICSNIPVFHEILGDIPIYFDPSNPQSLAGVLLKTEKNLFRVDEKKVNMLLKRYNWTDMANETLRLYNASI